MPLADDNKPKKLKENEKINEDNAIFATTLLPAIINEMVEKQNLVQLAKLKDQIREMTFKGKTKKSPMHIAAITGNTDIIDFLIKLNLNVNVLDDNNNTPLNYACLYKRKEAALMLKENGGLFKNDIYLGNVLCDLAVKGDFESLKLFNECGANLMVCNYDRKNIAHFAAQYGKEDIIKYLLYSLEFNIIVADRWGKTPYHYGTKKIRAIFEEKIPWVKDTLYLCKKRKKSSK